MSTTPSRGKAVCAVITATLLALLALAVLVAGCSGTVDPTTTSSGPVTTPTSGDSTTTTLPVALSDLDKELARTAKAQNALTKTLDDLKIADDDPWFGVSYALRARSQAIGCMQMLKKGDQASLDVADGVMLDIYHVLNLARGLANGTAAETIAAARAIADKVGAPSDRVDEALTLLDQFVNALLPLWSDLKSVYTQVIADHPDYAEAYVNLAQLIYDEGDKAGALALMDRGIAATTGDDKTMLEQLKEVLAASTPTS